MSFEKIENINQMLKSVVVKSPKSTAYRWFDNNSNEKSINWNEFSRQVDQVSKSLMTLGVKKGDKVSIISNTCFKWALVDLGIMSIGAVSVGVYQSNLPKDCEYIVNHSDSVLIFAEDRVQLEKIFEVKANLTRIKNVILFNEKVEDEWVLSFNDFLEIGEAIDDDNLRLCQSNIAKEDVACIVYTSGTTGVPKGAMLTHKNITFVTQSIFNSVDVKEGDSTLLFLPLAHVFARAILYTSLYAKITTCFNRNLDALLEDFQWSKPHWFASVPRIYEKVYGKINSDAEAKGGVALKIFNWACHVGGRVSDLRQKNQALSLTTKLQYWIASKLVFSKLHNAFGGRLRWCISGAAPMNPEIARFFDGAGIPVLEGIGMTENSSFSNINRLDNYRLGSVGQAGPGIEVMVSDDSELLVRGPNVMKAYFKMPEETSKNITTDGWLLTGDLATIDDKGFVSITGRKKDLIITAGGKNIAPSAIENLLTLSKYISQACIIGDKRRYLTALITLDLESVKSYMNAQGLEYSGVVDEANIELIRKLIDEEINLANQSLASFESIKKYDIVPEFTIENELLTPTLKVKRNLVMEHYAEKIEAMYIE